MKLLLISLFLVLYSAKALAAVNTFEFGPNVGHTVFTKSGSFSILEKIKRVSIVLPECTDLKYVRVDINDRFGPPSVSIDWDTNSVVMEYSLLQYSVSQYTISAKGVRQLYCQSDVNAAAQGAVFFDTEYV